MHWLKLTVAILASVLFGQKLEDTINKYLKPTADFETKLVHYGSPVATGIATYWGMGLLMGGKA